MATSGRVEVVSGELETDALLVEVAYVAEALAGLGASRVCVDHWYGTEDLAVADLAGALAAGFVDVQYHDAGFRVGLGLSDFTITAAGVPTEIEVCHHDEVHVVTDDAGLAQRFLDRWRGRGCSPRGPSAAPAPTAASES